METEILSNLITVAPVVGVLIWVILEYRKREKKAEKVLLAKDTEMKEKSIAHSVAMKEKDDKIQLLNDQIRNDAIESMSIFKDMHSNLKDLVNELKTRNNG